eukprot:990395-Pelagomonas_calceolata.AAC.2
MHRPQLNNGRPVYQGLPYLKAIGLDFDTVRRVSLVGGRVRVVAPAIHNGTASMPPLCGALFVLEIQVRLRKEKKNRKACACPVCAGDPDEAQLDLLDVLLVARLKFQATKRALGWKRRTTNGGELKAAICMCQLLATSRCFYPCWNRCAMAFFVASAVILIHCRDCQALPQVPDEQCPLDLKFSTPSQVRKFPANVACGRTTALPFLMLCYNTDGVPLYGPLISYSLLTPTGAFEDGPSPKCAAM